MEFALDCDTCDFHRVTEDEGNAYVLAKEHEREHGSHFVLITALAPSEGP